VIKVNGFVIKPTIFPDGTSQVWKLPEGLLSNNYVAITWYFEAERELLDVFSIRALFPSAKEIVLYMPYLPYARQDKDIDNNQTFSLMVFATLINTMGFHQVAAVDVHNPELCKKIFHNFVSYDVTIVQENLVGVLQPDCIVFPDAGAAKRYSAVALGKKKVVYTKKRDPVTGDIFSHELDEESLEVYRELPLHDVKFLIIDDICDGGATFINIANNINLQFVNPKISLFVTHGIFSKGMKPLEDAGITAYTTNSLLKNVEGFNV
jgi:ribose-phosphate pyrophosphokinase